MTVEVETRTLNVLLSEGIRPKDSLKYCDFWFLPHTSVILLYETGAFFNKAIQHNIVLLYWETFMKRLLFLYIKISFIKCE